MKSIFILICLCLTSLILAVEVKDMTMEQRAALQNELNQANATPKPVAQQVREEATQWATLGTNIGTAMISAAKELGMAVSEFSQTPLGKIVVVLVVYKVLGAVVMHILGATMLLTFGICFFWYVHRRFLMIPKYEMKPVLWGLWQKRTVVNYETNNKIDGTNRDAWETVSIFVLILSAIISLTLIVTATI